MKSLFTMRHNKGDEIGVIDRLVIRELSADQKSNLDGSREKVQKALRKAAPLWMIILATVFSFATVIIGAIIFDTEIGIDVMYQKVPYLFYIFGVCLLAVIVLWGLIIGRSQKLQDSAEFKDMKQRVVNEEKSGKLALSVPFYAEKIELLCPFTKVDKNGLEKRSTMYRDTYFNHPIDLFVEEENLCFADDFQVVALPLSSLKLVTKMKKWANINEWKKPEPFTDQKYKEYKLFYTDNSYITMRWHYVAVFEIDGEEIEVIIPNYDINGFIKVASAEIIDPNEKQK